MFFITLKNNLVGLIFWFALTLFTLIMPALHAAELTMEEKEWIRSHPELRVGTYEGGLPPLEDRVKTN